MRDEKCNKKKKIKDERRGGECAIGALEGTRKWKKRRKEGEKMGGQGKEGRRKGVDEAGRERK